MPPTLDPRGPVPRARLPTMSTPANQERQRQADARPERRVDLLQHGPGKLDPRDGVQLIGRPDQQSYPSADLERQRLADAWHDRRRPLDRVDPPDRRLLTGRVP